MPQRPIFQGDVFRDGPIVKAQPGDRREVDPRMSVERRTVAVIGYPCEMYAQGVLTRVQSVAVVREAHKLGVPENWLGAFGVCPVPDLFGDGALWAVDFRSISPVDRAYLRPDHRLACLTEWGWAYLRQRLALYYTRAAITIADLLEAGKPTWQETQLWQHWNESGRAPGEFQAWLDEFDPNIGFPRRVALQRGLYQVLYATFVGGPPRGSRGVDPRQG
ncbi:MAG: hypothetical protein HY690_11775 [Chloroflexi bacterium]|nr:hypothetical protein [Chloroflexota bacterium]